MKAKVFASILILLVILVTLTTQVNASPEKRGYVSISFDDGLASTYQNAYPIMQQYDVKGTFYIITDLIRDFSGNSEYMSIKELQTLQANGNEIGSHSKTHAYFPSLNDEQTRIELADSQQLLRFYGLTANNFAYPYGGANEHTDVLAKQYYHSARWAYTLAPYTMAIPFDNTILKGYGAERNDEWLIPNIQYYIDLAYSENSWIVFFFHDVTNNSEIGFGQIRTPDFTQFIEYAINKNVNIMTVEQVLDLSDVPSPTVTPQPTPSTSPSPTPEPTATPTPQPTETPKPTIAPTPTPTTTPEPTTEPTPTFAPTPTPSPKPTSNPTPPVTPTPTPVPTAEPTSSPTPEPTITTTPTPITTLTPTEPPNPTATPAPTSEPTNTPTQTPESTITPTIPPTTQNNITPKPTTKPTTKPTPTPTLIHITNEWYNPNYGSLPADTFALPYHYWTYVPHPKNYFDSTTKLPLTTVAFLSMSLSVLICAVLVYSAKRSTTENQKHKNVGFK